MSTREVIEDKSKGKIQEKNNDFGVKNTAEDDEISDDDSKSAEEEIKDNKNDKTIEIPQIKYNSKVFLSGNDETENDIGDLNDSD